MHKKIYGLGLVTALFLVVVGGCNKSEPEPKAPTSRLPTPDSGMTVARLHWLGKKRIAAENTATNFMAIWNLPESTKLEGQTLDKLATAPWRFFSAARPLSNVPAALLRPLLDDLVQEESYLEVRATTNQPSALVLAIRLDADRAALWRTNLAAVLESLTGLRSATSDFRLQTSDFSFALSHAGDWTLVSVMCETNRSSPLNAQHSTPAPLLADFTARIQRDHVPFAARATNYWLETDADLRAFAGWIPFSSAFRTPPSAMENLPLVKMTLIGDGENVRTRGELNFPGPLLMELEPWNIPTNLVHDPLIGFMGVRGIRPWLKSLRIWDEARLGIPPNQAFFWAQDGSAPLHFFGVPSVQASNQLHHLSEFLINDVNPLFASSLPTNGIRFGSFERVPDSQRIRWRGVPMVSPKVDLADAGGNPFITGGLFSNLVTNRPAPAELLRQFQTDTNLVFYDWEITQPAEYRWIQVSQVGRLVFGRARLSMTNNAALPWLVAISPKLGISGTSLRLAEANRLTFSRSSTLGFTGVELHLLADWLESPAFPNGFFTLEAKPMPLMAVPPPAPTTKP